MIAASLSDVLRLALLHEFGGVWVDASLFCHTPLDHWLPPVMEAGFFAFAKPGGGRPLASWFLAAEPGCYLINEWLRRSILYWKGREAADDYFWVHRLFGEMCEDDGEAAALWDRAPEISADGPHSLQFGGAMLLPPQEAAGRIDWSAPVYKLSGDTTGAVIPEGSALAYVLRSVPEFDVSSTALGFSSEARTPEVFAALKVGTENLGDHIQILAGLNLLDRMDVEPRLRIDRDSELVSLPTLGRQAEGVGILLNGWFKANHQEWPPGETLRPVFCGFHMRPFQCSELLSERSIDYLRRHQPIGCRDKFTTELLQERGVDAFTSHCLTLAFPRRIRGFGAQTEIFIVSRDDRILNFLPADLGPTTFLSHYSGCFDFDDNLQQAADLLQTYLSRARLLITTLLHCALTALAMGIPVVMFYPINCEHGHRSDQERFSSLGEILTIYKLDSLDDVDWNPAIVDVSALKLGLLTSFFNLATEWNLPPPTPIGPIVYSRDI